MKLNCVVSLLFSCVLTALVVGCASNSSLTGPEPTSTPTSPEVLLAQADRTKDPAERLGLLLIAAQRAETNLQRSGKDSDRLAYNRACAEFAVTWWKSGRSLDSVQTPDGTTQLTVTTGTSSGDWDPAFLNELLLPSQLAEQSLVQQTPLDGVGGFLVGVHQPKDPRAQLFPPQGIPVPVTAVLTTSEGNPQKATLTLYNPDDLDKIRIAGRTRPLAADFGAPFGYYRDPQAVGFMAMLRPAKYQMAEGIYMVQPYDPDKIPIVFVHGLMAIPQMWLPVMAAIENDPDLQGKFQFLAFDYPTGDPVAYMALELRRALNKLYEVYPDTRDMVVINHSLGGTITHMNVINPGNTFVDLFGDFGDKILTMSDDAILKEALVYEANPRIDEVIFIAAVHRGAPLAISWLGKFGSELIKLPSHIVEGIGEDTMKAALRAEGLKKEFVPNSIDALSPDNPLLKAMNTREIEVPFHSIIGVAGKPLAPLEKTSDTVVPYWSTHKEAAESEKIVYATHETIFATSEAIDEMKRILSLYLKGQR